MLKSNQPVSLKFIPKFLLSGLLLSTLAMCSTDEAVRQRTENEAAARREVEFGKLISLKILQKYALLEDAKATMYVNKVGKSVALFAGRSDIEYRFGILDSNIVNAYAAPGGYIFISRGALVSMQNEAQLAGVLGHEIAHVNCKHMLKMLPPPRETKTLVDRLASILSAQGSTVSTVMGAAVEQATEILFKKGLQHADEYEADQMGVQYSAETGYFARGLVDFLGIMQGMKEGHGESKAYNTHPPIPERINKINQILAQNDYSKSVQKLEQRFKENLGHLK